MGRKQDEGDETKRQDGGEGRARGAGPRGARTTGAAGRGARGPSRSARPDRPGAAGRDRTGSPTERPRLRATHGSTSLPGLDTGYRGEAGGAKGRPAKPGGRTGPRSAAARAATAKKALRALRPAPPLPGEVETKEAITLRAEEMRPQRAPAKRRSVAPPPEPSSASKELAIAIASAGLDKKALGIEVLDVTGRVDYADFLVIMTGSSDRHVHAIATGIEEALSKKKIRPLSVEGLTAGTWVLIDFDDVVVHVFQEETRRVYDIEGLWMDARRVEVAEPQRRG